MSLIRSAIGMLMFMAPSVVPVDCFRLSIVNLHQYTFKAAKPTAYEEAVGRISVINRRSESANAAAAPSSSLLSKNSCSHL
jgi:hypothetical protein